MVSLGLSDNRLEPDLRPSVVIPFRGGCPHRERALAWVLDRYSDQGFDARPHGCPDGPWIKALAVMPALRSADEIVVVADADVWCDGLQEAIQAVEDGAAWAMPHLNVRRLSAHGTDALLAGEADCELSERPYPGMHGGGIVVAKRDTLLEVPLDPRFHGWGQEDESWGIALHHLLGPAWRGTADLLHLHHPPPERLSRRRGNPESWRLRRRYHQARHTPKALRTLLTEAHDALAALEPDLHADSPQPVR